jgi:ABC-type phosphate/phosphonate transport system substrate-binding protein
MHQFKGFSRGIFTTAAGMAALLVSSFTLAQEKPKVLEIGSSGTTAINASNVSEDAAIDTLKSFVKSETGFDNDIKKLKDWNDLCDKMAHGQYQLGEFQGYEFAWAQKKYPELKPIAIALNGSRYLQIYLIVKKEDGAKDFAGLQGKILSLPHVSEGALRLYVDHLCQENGKLQKDFFSKINTPDNTEDSLDDVVDGVVQAAVVDRVSVEAYRRRKPGRFAKLKEISHSEKLPPPVIAYVQGKVDDATLKQVEKGLLNANQSERGQRLLQLFKLTGFEKPSPEYDQLLAESLKKYPPPAQSTPSGGR